MWAKLLAAIFIISFIYAGFYLMKKDAVTPKVKEPVQDVVETAHVQREAKNVVMYEKRLDSDKNFIIHAQDIVQKSSSDFTMNEFNMDRTDGLKISGDRAEYDMSNSKLNIIGPMTVNTPDGWKANLTDVVWDRQTKHAITDKPVMVQGDQGTIHGNQAEFFDDFSRIQLSGGVHAKIAQGFFTN